AAGSIAGEARRFDKSFQLLRERRLFIIADAGSKANVVQFALGVVKPEQQRADKLRVALVAKAANDAIGSADPLHLQHGTFAWAVGCVSAFGDNTVERSTAPFEPALGDVTVQSVG